jgi:hypothetical protein
MGKATLIMVAVSVLVFGGMIYQVQQSSFEARAAEAENGEMVLAREVARSGLNAVVSQVKRDFDSWRSGYLGTMVRDGSFDASVSGTAAGPVEVTVDAYQNEEMYRIRTRLARLSSAAAAVIVDADSVEVSYDGSDFVLTGKDTRPASSGIPFSEGSGKGSFVNAVMTNANGAWLAFTDALTSTTDDNVRGKASETDVVNATLPVDPEDLYDEAVAHATQTYTSSQTFSGSTTIGAASAPAIVVVQGDATLSGDVKGYGMLVVEGDLTMTDNALWEGIILTLDADAVTLSGNARHYGALVIRDTEGDPDNLVEFEITGDQVIPQECYQASVTVLGAALSYGGTYDLMVTNQFTIGTDSFEPWGDYDLAVTGNVNDDANPRTYMADEDYPAGTAINVYGKSWMKYSGTSGSSNSNWYTWMAANTTVESQQIKVLKNGDPVPNIAGFLDQNSIEEFVADYVVDGYMVLEPNQAIYLFELGTTNVTGIDADFQDLVTLVTLSEGDGCPDGGDVGTGSLDVRLSGGTNDAEQSGSTVTTNSYDLDFGSQTVGMRFTNVTIPTDATITSAYIQFKANSSSSSGTTLNFYGQDTDNASAFSTSSNNISSRTKTSAVATWTPGSWSSGGAGSAQQTPNLSAVVQEIVDRDGWASGNALAFIVTGSGWRESESYEGSSSYAPLLHVEWTTPPPPPPPPPAFSISGNAGIYYSTEAIGKLAVYLPSVKASAWVVEQDRWIGKPTYDDVDETPTIDKVCHTTNGVSRTLSVSASAVDAHLAHGDTEGACVQESNGGGGHTVGGGITTGGQ